MKLAFLVNWSDGWPTIVERSSSFLQTDKWLQQTTVAWIVLVTILHGENTAKIYTTKNIRNSHMNFQQTSISFFEFGEDILCNF